MANVLSYFDSDYLREFDLPTPEYLVEIESVSAGELTSVGGRKTKKPLVKFKGHAKALALNKTNSKSIAKLYGYETDAWIGKKIMLFRSSTEMAGETVACIRCKAPK